MSKLLDLLKEKAIPQDYSTYLQKILDRLVIPGSAEKPIEKLLAKESYWEGSPFDFLTEEWFLKAIPQSMGGNQPSRNIVNQLPHQDKYYDLIFNNGHLAFIHPNLKNEINILNGYDNQKQNLLSHFKKLPQNNWFLNFNEYLGQEFVYLKITENKDRPLRLVFINDENNQQINNTQIFIHLASEKELTLVEEHLGDWENPNPNHPTFNNYSLKVIGEKASKLHHIYHQNESLTDYHIHHTHVELYEQAKYVSHVLQQGAALSIAQRSISFSEEEAECSLYGVNEVGNNQSHNNIISVDHAIPRCTSRQLYKGILDGKSQLSFTGRVQVAQDAQQTDSYQLNNNLILSDDATMRTRPELEIHADDVKCSHGATSRNLNADELFYLNSRGLNQEKAKKLLVRAFTADFYKTLHEILPQWEAIN